MFRGQLRLLAPIIGVVCLAALIYFSTAAVRAQQPTPPPYDPAAVPTPEQTPAAAFGRGLFLQNCAPCHGELGNSDGPTTASLPAAPPLFSDPATIWARSPGEYFHVTKFGRIQNLMPPWGNQLSDTQIWQAVYYAWSLHTDQAKVESGGQLYAASCAGCHGVAGASDGPDAPAVMPNFSDGAAMLVRTQAELDAGWQAMHPEAGQDWSQDERRNVLDYIRTFSYTPPWESALKPGNGMLEGQVRQGTPNGGVINMRPITLTAYVNFEPAQALTTTTDAEGRFTFAELSTAEGVVYQAETTYADVRYNSNIVALTPLTPTLSVDLPVYETTDDDSGIGISRANWLLDQEPGALIVGQVFNFANRLDRTFVGKIVEGLDRPATLALSVPEGATDIQFQDGVLGGRYQQVGTRIYDIVPVPPGSDIRQIVLQYRLPFEDDSATLEQPFPYRVGQLNLLIPELPNVQTEVTGLTQSEAQTIQGVNYRVWVGDELSNPVQITLSGLTPVGSADSIRLGPDGTVLPSSTPPLENNVLLGVGAVLVLGLAIAAYLPLRKQGRLDRKAALQQEKAALVEHIARLDDQHANGELQTQTWAQERARLKATLLEVAQEITLNEEQKSTDKTQRVGA